MARTRRTDDGERAGGRAPHQLPSGRHGLSRDYVTENQRDRILAAVVEVARGTGYSGLTIREVITRAGVSRRTFYELFNDKEEVFLAAYDHVAGRLADQVREATEEGSDWPDQVYRGLETFLERLASDPAVAHLCIVEVLAAGPSALSRRAAALEAFRPFLEPGTALAPEGVVQPALATELAIGGAYEVVYTYVLQGRAEDLPELLPELVHIVLLPFLGLRRSAAAAGAAGVER